MKFTVRAVLSGPVWLRSAGGRHGATGAGTRGGAYGDPSRRQDPPGAGCARCLAGPAAGRRGFRVGPCRAAVQRPGAGCGAACPADEHHVALRRPAGRRGELGRAVRRPHAAGRSSARSRRPERNARPCRCHCHHACATAPTPSTGAPAPRTPTRRRNVPVLHRCSQRSHGRQTTRHAERPRGDAARLGQGVQLRRAHPGSGLLLVVLALWREGLSHARVRRMLWGAWRCSSGAPWPACCCRGSGPAGSR